MISFVWIYFWLYCIYFQLIQTGKIIHTINHIKNKKIVSISPGGYKGFYSMGIASYIKDHYNMANCIFSGASAGAWVSLFMTYKGNNKYLIDKLEIFSDDFYSNAKNLFLVEQKMKKNLLSNFKTEDFDLSKLFIGVVQIDNNIYNINTHIYSNFDSLEDAINCCISSSHIPLITGNILKLYNNKYTFDGGFSSFPYLTVIDGSIFHIHPSIWEKKEKKINENILYYNIKLLYSYSQLLVGERMHFYDLYKTGYNDSIRNKEQLDNFFILK